MSVLWELAPLAREHDCRGFDCGDEDLNRYLRQFAERHSKRGTSRTYVAVPIDEPARVIGYFTVAMGAVSAEAAVTDESLPRHPVPVLHLARLAVATEFQGQNSIGPGLLGEVHEIALDLADRIGCYAIDCYAKTERAKRFYVRQGFIQLKDDDLHLWIRLKDLRASHDSML